MTDRAGDPIVRGMHRPLALYAFAILTFSACAPDPLPTVGGTYQCDAAGSAMNDACDAIVPDGIPYCGTSNDQPQPFDGCKSIAATPPDIDWWCCPRIDGGAS